MGDVIDLTLVSRARRYFEKLLAARGLSYFLETNASRPLRIDAKKVALVVRAAARDRTESPSRAAVEHCRQEIRRQLIRQVAQTMLQIGF